MMNIDKSMLSRDYEISPLRRGYSSRYGSSPGEIPPDSDIYYLYITVNLSIAELGAFFGRKRDSALLWVKHHAIEKSRALIEEKMALTKTEKYGCPTWNNTEKCHATKLAKYGKRGTGEGAKRFWQNITSQRRHEVINKRKKTCMSRFGYTNCMLNPDFKYQFLRNMRRRATKPEKDITAFLISIGIKFEAQYVVRYHKWTKVYDWYLPDYNTLLEFDGNFWHRLDYQKENDQLKNFIAKELGYRIVRIKGEDNINLLWEIQ